jgi:histidinol dehydrogenase
VLRVINLRGRRTAGERLDYAAIVPRADFDVAAATEIVRPICEDVARRGTAALADYSMRFDRVLPATFRVPRTAMETAAARLHPDLRKAFATAIERRRRVCETELGDSGGEVSVAPGAVVRRRMIPVSRVGLYVPGGLAPLASSVIMNVVPAKVAGVPSIALASPVYRTPISSRCVTSSVSMRSMRSAGHRRSRCSPMVCLACVARST